MGALELVAQWDGRHGAAVLRRRSGGVDVVAVGGDVERRFPHASVTKVASSLAVLCVVQDGTARLDDPVGPPGATLAHVLAHASGLPLDGLEPVAAPGARRIYSNTGIDLAVAHAAQRAHRSASVLVDERVYRPLGMGSTSLEGPASSGAVGTTVDLCRLASELLAPTLLAEPLAADWRRVAFPGLDGVLPAYGRQVPCDFGLGVEVKGTKHPHWTGPSWPPRSVGHFGRRSGFVLADPDAGLALVTLSDELFGRTAMLRWPSFTDAVRAEHLG